MRERPILFNGAMVRAILDGTKTQTRRVVKPQPRWCPRPPGALWDGDGYWLYGSEDPERGDQWSVVWDDRTRRAACTSEAYGWGARAGCPYGTTGDRLWVRETWRRAPEGFPDGIQYREKTTLRYFDGSDPAAAEAAAALSRDGRWRPSIHMPRWASRITLEITDVRVERVQDISEEDARAEGFETGLGAGRDILSSAVGTSRALFSDEWDSIYAAKGLGWDANPWVWVIEFRRAEVTR